MLVSSNCSCASFSTTVDASLDLETENVICNQCGDIINGISSFAKNSMKISGDVIKKPKRAFSFKCISCDKYLQVAFINHKACGKDCQTPGKCMFKITESMRNAIEVCQSDDENRNKRADEVNSDMP